MLTVIVILDGKSFTLELFNADKNKLKLRAIDIIVYSAEKEKRQKVLFLI